MSTRNKNIDRANCLLHVGTTQMKWADSDETLPANHQQFVCIESIFYSLTTRCETNIRKTVNIFSSYFLQKMLILQESRRIISYAGLGNAKLVQIGGWYIPRSIIRIIISMALIACIILECFICIHMCEHGIAMILLPFGVLVTQLSLTLIYSTFVWKTNEIDSLMDYLEFLINKSNQ